MEMGWGNFSWLLISVLLIVGSHLSSSFTATVEPVRRLMHTPLGSEGMFRWQSGAYARLTRQQTTLQAAPGMLERIVQARVRSKEVASEAQKQKQAQAKAAKKKEILYRVVVYNDDIHTFDQAQEALYQRVPGLSYQAAQQLTFVIDDEGQSPVAVLPLEQAQVVSQALQQYGLTSSIEPFSVNEEDLKD